MQKDFADIPDELWDCIQRWIPSQGRHAKGGSPFKDNRRAMAGIVYRLKTGCQWDAIPKEFGSGSTCYRLLTLRRCKAPSTTFREDCRVLLLSACAPFSTFAATYGPSYYLRAAVIVSALASAGPLKGNLAAAFWLTTHI